MIVTFDGHNTIKLKREKSDPKFYDGGWGSGESRLLFFLKRKLNIAGCGLVKKRMCADWHLVSDEQRYLRTQGKKGTPHIAIYDGDYAIRNMAEAWNKSGVVSLIVIFDMYYKQPVDEGRQLLTDLFSKISNGG